MRDLYAILGHWLWFVWAAMAVLVVYGYVRVRRNINRLERMDDVADSEARKRHAAKRRTKGRGEIE